MFHMILELPVDFMLMGESLFMVWIGSSKSCGKEGQFFFVICNGKERDLWEVFSSETDTWTETSGEILNTTFFDPERHSIKFIVTILRSVYFNSIVCF